MKVISYQNAYDKIMKCLEKLHPFQLPRDYKAQLIREMADKVMSKAVIVKPEKPKHHKRVYVIVSKDDWEKWQNKVKNGKQISVWKQKIAGMDFDSMRKNVDGTEAIFEIKLKVGDEYNEFISDNYKLDDNGNIKGTKKNYHENSSQGKHKFVKKLNEDENWTPKEIDTKPPSGGGINVKPNGGMQK